MTSKTWRCYTGIVANLWRCFLKSTGIVDLLNSDNNMQQQSYSNQLLFKALAILISTPYCCQPCYMLNIIKTHLTNKSVYTSILLLSRKYLLLFTCFLFYKNAIILLREQFRYPICNIQDIGNWYHIGRVLSRDKQANSLTNRVAIN